MALFSLLVAAALVSSESTRSPASAEEDSGRSMAIAGHGVQNPCDTTPQCATDTSKPIFFDMLHSNNAARVRLFIRLYANIEVAICMVTYADMRCPWFEHINPNQKVPAIILPSREILYESNVIYEYMVDTYGIPLNAPVPFQHRDLSAINRAKVNLMCRVHDLYVASPNCNQPGCTHSQGALYLPPPGDMDPTGGRRAIDIDTRSRKMAELWTRWVWLEEFSHTLSADAPFLAGSSLSMADTTWFPTAVFMEFLLTYVAGWPVLFADYDAESGTTHPLSASSETWNPGPVDPKMLERFPKLTAWFPRLLKINEFRDVRAEIMSFWLNELHLDTQWFQKHQDKEVTDPKERKPRFLPIKDAIWDALQSRKDLAWKPVPNGTGPLIWPSSQ